MKVSLVAVFLAGTAAAAPALAQSAAVEPAPPVAVAPDTDGRAIDVIVVTAQRRAESLQDVPVSVAAFTGDIVEAAGAVNLTDLNGLSPNVVFQPEGLVPNIPMIAIRGMSSSDPDPNADPKVSTIIDGVYVPYAAGTMLDLFDIERIEVLKGPQGVLFGKNNLAGTINVVTSRPTVDPGAEIRGTIGSFGLRQLRAKVNSGEFLNGLFAAKASLNLRRYDGYSDNVVTGNELNTNDVDAYRVALRFSPAPVFESTITLDGLDDETFGPAPHVVDNGDPRYDLLPAEARNDIRKSAILFDPYSRTDTFGVAWESDLEVGDGTVTLVLGYRDLDYETLGDFDGLTEPDPGFEVNRAFEGESKSAELRYTSPVGGLIDFVAGLYWAEDDSFRVIGFVPRPRSSASPRWNRHPAHSPRSAWRTYI
ncbi:MULTISPECIES: TonB-dependent receptor [Pacificimonas]|nr:MULTISPECIES: TonB-dependent receptor [Pacificimonas]MBZ6379592.1 TonB-dependent receptor [Pacificimonas aurantium]